MPPADVRYSVNNLALSGLLLLLTASAACRLTAFSAARQLPQGERTNRQTGGTAPGPERSYGGPAVIAWLSDPDITESSGIVASRRNPGVLWTHNDSGDGPFLYATDEQGRARGVWRVSGADAVDWEDIALGPGPQPSSSYLYIGDIGDNQEKRAEIVVYRVPEPAVTTAEQGAGKRNAQVTERAEAIRLQYPDGRHNAEALLVHPATGALYVVTKTVSAAPSLYELEVPYSTAAVNRLRPLGKIAGVPGGFITGGDVAPDGRRVVLCDYIAAYELRLPDGAPGFDQVWGQNATRVDLGERRQGESICYAADGQALYATSEERPTPLIKVARGGR